MGNKCKNCEYQFNNLYPYRCPMCNCKTDQEAPYSHKEYEEAKKCGFDLDDWNDYVDFFGLGEREEYK